MIFRHFLIAHDRLRQLSLRLRGLGTCAVVDPQHDIEAYVDAAAAEVPAHHPHLRDPRPG